MNNRLLYRLRTNDGTSEVRSEWRPDVTLLLTRFVQANEDNQHAWAAVDILYPDGESESDIGSWNSASGFVADERDSDGGLYRVRTGGGRGLRWTSEWESWRKARDKWQQAMKSYADTPPAWAVLDKRTSDGAVSSHRVWKASEEAQPDNLINRKK